jgi:hypothetical protein
MTDLDVDNLDAICADLCTPAGLPAPIRREPIRARSTCGVDRIIMPGRRTAILKYGGAPFTAEVRILRAAGIGGVPVPQVLAAGVYGRMLVMLLEDLGDGVREANDVDGAAAAATLHRADLNTGRLRIWGSRQLCEIPDSAMGLLSELRAAGRLPTSTDLVRPLARLARQARTLTVDADMPPFGLVHGDLHPTSVHISQCGWHLIDFAMAFTGPGLLDLASWQGIRNRPDPGRVAAQIDAYTAAGGDLRAQQPRGGLPAAVWALGWHRLWSVAWLLHQAVTADDDTDDRRIEGIIRRQLASAAALLC